MRSLLRRLLESEGFACREANSGDVALTILKTDPVPLMLLEYQSPGMDGAAMLRLLQQDWPETAVILVTAVADLDLIVKSVEAGAVDYVTKPFRPHELRARVSQALEKRRLLVENRAYRLHLEERVVIQTRKYEDLFLASLQSLADALEVKDPYTAGHSTRVTEYALAIGQELGLPETLMEQLELGSRLHDIGKIGVREALLVKDGTLTDDEYAHIMEHPVIGWRLLEPLLRELPHALSVVRSHHERYDGRGLPDRLLGHEIPLEARIVGLADSFDAMTSGRAYRSWKPVDVAMAELKRCAGTQFDPVCVAAFERVVEQKAVKLPDANSHQHRDAQGAA